MPWIDKKIEPELHAIIAKELRNQGCIVHEVNGIEDHIHLVHTLPRTKTIAQIMRCVKSVSSKWIKTRGEQYAWFGWQDGYAPFSVDYRRMKGVCFYVRNQKKYHGTNNSKMTFVDEFEKFMEAYGYPDYTKHYVFPDKPDDYTLREPVPSHRFKNRAARKRWRRRESKTTGSTPIGAPEGPLA